MSTDERFSAGDRHWQDVTVMVGLARTIPVADFPDLAGLFDRKRSPWRFESVMLRAALTLCGAASADDVLRGLHLMERAEHGRGALDGERLARTPARVVATLCVPDQDPRVLLETLRILGREGPAGLYPPLLRTLAGHPDAPLRAAAVGGLRPIDEDFGDTSFDSLVRAALADPEPTVRQAAQEALQHWDAPDAPHRMVTALDDPDPAVRAHALGVLTGLAGVRVHSSPMSRFEFYRSRWGHRHGEALFAKTRALLTDEEAPEVVAAAAGLLVLLVRLGLGSAEAAEAALRGHAGTQAEEARLRVLSARAIFGDVAARDSLRALASAPSPSRAVLREAFLVRELHAALDAIVDRLADSDWTAVTDADAPPDEGNRDAFLRRLHHRLRERVPYYWPEPLSPKDW
ncbi:hypothetical protein GCM10022221_66200 [Actinocorallia aurea]